MADREMTYEELYEAVRSKDENRVREAREELSMMSENDWLNYVCYRNSRESKNHGS